jgi:hypothetical protein
VDGRFEEARFTIQDDPVTVITDIEEETLDLDWFSVDAEGAIAHFASGGRGFLPMSVKASKEDLDLTAYFRAAPKNGHAVASPRLSSQKQFESDAQKAKYLADYAQMGERGFFSFDCIVGPRRPTGYFLVVQPSLPLRLEDLPLRVREIMRRCAFERSFSISYLINESDFTR